jgi:hypothetical protein
MPHYCWFSRSSQEQLSTGWRLKAIPHTTNYFTLYTTLAHIVVSGVREWQTANTVVYKSGQQSVKTSFPACGILPDVLPNHRIIYSEIFPPKCLQSTLLWYTYKISFFFVTQQPKSGISRLIVHVSKSHTIGHIHTYIHTHTHTNTHRVGLHWTSDHLVACVAIWQPTTNIREKIYDISGIRTRNSSIRVAADLRLRSKRHRDRQLAVVTFHSQIIRQQEKCNLSAYPYNEWFQASTAM